MWLIDEAVKDGYTSENTVLYLLLVEFIALHTTATVSHDKNATSECFFG